MLADTGGTGVGLIGQQGRAEQGLEMHWTEVTLAVTNRCSSLLSVSRRACHAVSARLPCAQCIQWTGQWTALHCSAPHMQVNGRDRLPQASGWTAQPRPGSCIEAAYVVYRIFWDASSPAVCLASPGCAVWYEEPQERG